MELTLGSKLLTETQELATEANESWAEIIHATPSEVLGIDHPVLRAEGSLQLAPGFIIFVVGLSFVTSHNRSKRTIKEKDESQAQ